MFCDQEQVSQLRKDKLLQYKNLLNSAFNEDENVKENKFGR